MEIETIPFSENMRKEMNQKVFFSYYFAPQQKYFRFVNIGLNMKK